METTPPSLHSISIPCGHRGGDWSEVFGVWGVGFWVGGVGGGGLGWGCGGLGSWGVGLRG